MRHSWKIRSGIEFKMKNLEPQHQMEVQPGEDYSYPILDVILSSKRTIAAIFAVFLLLGTAYAFLARPLYQADVVVQIEDSPQGTISKGVLGDVSSLFDVQSTGADETLILQSRLVVTSAVDNLKLYIDASPRYFPIVGFWISKFHTDRGHGLSEPGLFGFGGYAWGDESIDVERFDVPQVYESDRFRLTVLAGNRYRIAGSDLTDPVEGEIGVEKRFPTAAGAMTVKVSRVHANPGTTFSIYRYSRLDTIQRLQTNLIVQQSDKQSNVIAASIEGKDPRRITRIMNEIGDQYVAQNVQRKAAQAAQSLTFLNTQLPDLKQQLQLAEERYTRFRNEHGTIDLTAEAQISLQELSQNQAQIVALQAKRGDLLQHLTALHPTVLGVDQQIQVLRQRDAQISGQIKGLPSLQQEVVRLTLDVSVNTQLYTSLLNSAQELQLVEAGATGNVRVVDRALLPEVPTKPRKLLAIAIAGFFGIFFAACFVILRDMLFGGVTDASELERHTGLTVMASIAMAKDASRLEQEAALSGLPKVLARTSPNDVAVEAMRSLRTAMQFALLDARNNIVLFAGPSPGVGKSFVASNMATLVGMANKRTLLVDGDIRKGRLHEIFGVLREGGLADVIAGKRTLADAIHRNVGKNLDLLTTGTLPPNPAELLTSGALSDVLGQLAKTYDVVILDTAPLLAATDAELFAPEAGAVVLVSMAGLTKVGEVLESVKRLRRVGVHLPGIVINGVNPNRGKFGYGSKYGAYRYSAYRYEPGSGDLPK